MADLSFSQGFQLMVYIEQSVNQESGGTHSPSLRAVTAGLRSRCWSTPAPPSSAQWASPRPRHGAGDPTTHWGCWELHKSRLESRSLGCASGCVCSFCRAGVFLPGSPGFSPRRRAPSKSPRFSAEPPPSPAAASLSRSGRARSEASLLLCNPGGSKFSSANLEWM